MKNEDNFSFAFSLEVLNHLGRGLYRSFATVIAEAVSNSWDAGATEVKITLDDNKLIVEDNGKGMNKKDFQDKFLTVGYSRRQDPTNKSKRNVIGRKGIGKLAMLSISEKVTVISKKEGQDITGGIVNNKELDKEIKDRGSYVLGNLSDSIKNKFPRNKKFGTIIVFENIKTKLNSPDVIRKYLATQFNFIFSLRRNDSFSIIVNNKKIDEKDLKELDENTQFIWFMGQEDRKRKSRYVNLEESRTLKAHSFKFGSKTIDIKGYIASVKLPNNLLLRGSKGDFKASINLFTNGRLRQENLFQEITSKQLPEEYLYGEIHVDGFEDEENDRFTSSREGIIKDDPLYQKFLEELKKIQFIVLKEWNALRIKYRHEADINTDKRPGYEVRMNESRNRRAKDFENKLGENIKDKKTKKTLKDMVRDLSYKNTLIYQDLFILENIFREYIKIKGIKENNFNVLEEEEKEVIDYIKSTRGLRKKDEERHALKGKIIQSEHYLNYADLWCLATIVDILIKNNPKKPIPKKYRQYLSADAKEINPVRNPIMHTNEITDHVMNWDKIKNVVDYIEKLK
jgi:hypothetical protein